MNIKNSFANFKKGSTYSSLLLAITQSIIALFFILFDFIFSKSLTVEQFGYWKEMFFLINLGIPLLSFGIPEGYKYYLAKEGKHKVIFSNTLITFFIISFFLAIILIIFNALHYFNWIDLNKYYLISLFFPIAYLASNINRTLRYGYINESKVPLHSRITLICYLLTLVLTIIIYFYLNQLKSHFLLIGVLLFIALYAFPIYVLIKKAKLVFKPKWFNKAFIKKVLKQGLPLYLATFIGTISVNLDKSIVSIFEDKETFAIFSVGALEIPIFAMLSAAFSQNIYPKLVKLINSDKKEDAKNLWISTTKKVSYFTYPLLLILMIFSKEIIFFIYNENYQESVLIFQTYLLIGLVRNNYYGALITASGQTKYITLYSVSMLSLNLILSLILYSYLGIFGIVLASLFSTLFIQFLQLNHEKMIRKYIVDFLMDFKIATLILVIFSSYLWQIL
ncbi:lipopolysaccharide biosynthesis protein [Brumimicrobium mesophilum]|uniref:lipopolysaccharide biosynthesis protein n=1 Tax=Brumimicrobium mesophilum TaxID=392717 RepID=UPI000D1426DD|nr:hypothetical protein [Brumimicrobium mesophilum]